jgi:putative DNA topoisomerase
MSNKIDHQLFSAHEGALTEHQQCPQCGGALQLRHGKSGPFLGCLNYPQCNFIRSLHHNDGHIIKELGVPCPVCSNELVLRQGRYGMFIGCSHYPECHYIESINEPAAAPANDGCPCPECHKGRLIERKARNGKAFWSCDLYPKCKFLLNFKPYSGLCTECGFPLLMAKKYVSGQKLVCASRKCGHIQPEPDVS